MLNDIHNHWKHAEAVRIKCMGVPTVDMKNVCSQLEVLSLSLWLFGHFFILRYHISGWHLFLVDSIHNNDKYVNFRLVSPEVSLHVFSFSSSLCGCNFFHVIYYNFVVV